MKYFVMSLGDLHLLEAKVVDIRKAGYVTVSTDRTHADREYVHRLVVGASAEQKVDHRNGDPRDNRRENLRLCTQAQNLQNRRPSRAGSSKYKGVSWDRARSRWRATIAPAGKSVLLGRFVTEQEAALAYNAAALVHYGEFARLNEVFHGDS